MEHHRHVGPLGAERAGGSSQGFLDRFLPRMASNTVAMAGVALVTFLLVTGEDAEQDAVLADARSQLAQMEQERDRMHALNQELAREVHDADMAAEIARWQLRWTEERLRRVEAEGAVALASARPTDAAPLARRLGGSVGAGADLEPDVAPEAFVQTLPTRASVEALDPQAQAWLDDKIARHVGDEAAGDDGAGEARALRLDDVPFEPDIPTLRSAPSQLDRDQALARWKTIVQDTADEECGARRSETVRYRSCRDEVERALFPYSGVAVTCLLSDNAVPDYVSGLDQDDAPSHSVLLGKGALLLCDAALPNL